jgi:hypothetical protein
MDILKIELYNFVICFFMKLSLFNNPSHEFNRLVHGDLRFFFIFIFYHHSIFNI